MLKALSDADCLIVDYKMAGIDGLELARALHAAQATRSARKDGGAVRVQLDPAEVA